MSDEAVIALVAVAVSGIVGLATLGFHFWNASSERRQRFSERKEDSREWYKRTLFERRLQAIQEGRRWLTRLWAIYDPIGGRGSAPIGDAMAWYENNIIYVHGEMPANSPIGRFLYGVEESMANGAGFPDNSEWVAAIDHLNEKARALFEELER
ncbi:MAG: hypothetical protein WD379_08650 [Dehalococcoidia bacterium]